MKNRPKKMDRIKHERKFIDRVRFQDDATITMFRKYGGNPGDVENEKGYRLQ
jgi:hypothetical protein